MQSQPAFDTYNVYNTLNQMGKVNVLQSPKNEFKPKKTVFQEVPQDIPLTRSVQIQELKLKVRPVEVIVAPKLQKEVKKEIKKEVKKESVPERQIINFGEY